MHQFVAKVMFSGKVAIPTSTAKYQNTSSDCLLRESIFISDYENDDFQLKYAYKFNIVRSGKIPKSVLADEFNFLFLLLNDEQITE